ncbi:MAG: EutN/CcmL family microcompartment protein [Polyangia bacterium]|jgi:ethanolamine utilization protein EutN|nr:EutN/CcmL family microcompartment protein [Polyangia bacterium]
MARVIGQVVSTVKEDTFLGYTLLVLEPVDSSGAPSEPSFLAIDLCQAGPGDHVLVLQEGNSIRSLIKRPRGAVDSAAVGVIDYVESGGRQRRLGTAPSRKESGS